MAQRQRPKKIDMGLLTSVDEKGRRLGIIPAEVKGFYRRHRVWFHWVLLVIFLVLPWTQINGMQTLLFNVPDRKFILLGVMFRAHDLPLLFFIFALSAIGLAFVTHLWGRIWCGWACPQTVFVETVFRGLERLTQGNYIERRKLQSAPWSLTKGRKVAAKWFLFTVVSVLISHSFMAYFVGAQDLLQMTQKPPQENYGYFLLVLFFTGLVLFDFGWFREQFCVIMCPYGRFQSLLHDKSSLAIVYDTPRGEPRKGTQPAGAAAGDCVSCNRCVEVCPTGIDIRNGFQMECIACTACIDACDEIMTKVKKPKGLIKYAPLEGAKQSLKNPRTVVYSVLMLLLTTGLVYSLATRESFHMTLLRGKGVPYSQVTNIQGEDVLLNQFHLHLQNQSFSTSIYSLELREPSVEGVELAVAENPMSLEGGASRDWFFFVRFPHEVTAAAGKKSLTLQVRESNGERETLRSLEVPLIGPRGAKPAL